MPLQFLLIFRKASLGELESSGLNEIFQYATEIDVDKEGVKGAKNFFEAKVKFKLTFGDFKMWCLLTFGDFKMWCLLTFGDFKMWCFFNFYWSYIF